MKNSILVTITLIVLLTTFVIQFAPTNLNAQETTLTNQEEIDQVVSDLKYDRDAFQWDVDSVDTMQAGYDKFSQADKDQSAELMGALQELRAASVDVIPDTNELIDAYENPVPDE